MIVLKPNYICLRQTEVSAITIFDRSSWDCQGLCRFHASTKPSSIFALWCLHFSKLLHRENDYICQFSISPRSLSCSQSKFYASGEQKSYKLNFLPCHLSRRKKPLGRSHIWAFRKMIDGRESTWQNAVRKTERIISKNVYPYHETFRRLQTETGQLENLQLFKSRTPQENISKEKLIIFLHWVTCSTLLHFLWGV